MITERTRQEMEAGARVVASNTGMVTGPEYMDAVLRTADRYAQLQAWEAEGRLRLVKQVGHDQYGGGTRERWVEVRIGRFTFDSRKPEYQAAGSFPSELMFAQIALALNAQQDKTNG